MEILKIEDFSFKFPNASDYTLRNINLSLNPGEFVLLMGISGSGKTTLLRQCKRSLAAFGEKSGNIYFDGKNINELDLRDDASGIGFVQQDPENQIVTDKVWHELAFGLESLGMDQKTMRLKVGEIAGFFGMESWFNSKVTDLSGGQLQMVNLASILAMQPKLLLLDEPTAMLDPIASIEFFQGLNRVCRELGITVLLSEHRLTEPYPLAERVLYLDDGLIKFDGSPKDFAISMKKDPDEIVESLPSPVQIYVKSTWEGEVPLTVGDALRSKPNLKDISVDLNTRYKNISTDAVLELRDIFFRYEKNSRDILKGLNLSIKDGEIYSVLGGNGAGKSTMLKLIVGVEIPSRGKIIENGEVRRKGKVLGDIALVPQHPKALFVHKEAVEELNEMTDDNTQIEKISELFELDDILKMHPFDLSGGEMQRLAIAKVLLKKPHLLLLDEPTKGMDGNFKNKFKNILRDYVNSGNSVLMVSHDTEFCAEVSDRCSLFFNGESISDGNTRGFFSGNHFYTTAANKIFRTDNDSIITTEDAVSFINKIHERI